MRLKWEEKERQFRALYEAFYRNPRIRRKEIADLLNVNHETALTRMNEAYDQGWVSKSQIRLRSFKNLGEYVYFLRCRNPSMLFSQLVDKEDVIYHALCSGEINMWIVSREKLSLPCECDVLHEGLRSDYHISFPPNQTWDVAAQNMREMVKEFNPEEYEPQRIIDTLWHETIEWNSEYEALFKEFNYDLSKPISPILANHCIPWEKVNRFLKNVSTYCTVMTGYYPGGISSCDPYLFMFETDYGDFLVNLFSRLPTTALFFKVSDRLFAYLHVKKEYMRVVNSQVHIRKLQIPSMLMDLLESGIILRESHGIVECYWHGGS